MSPSPLLPLKMSGNPRWRSSMSQVAEKCIRLWGGTYVSCIIDKDRRRWDLQPQESSGLTESIFCLFCPPDPFFFLFTCPSHLIPPFLSFFFVSVERNPFYVFETPHKPLRAQCHPVSPLTRGLCTACFLWMSREIVSERRKSIQQNQLDARNRERGELNSQLKQPKCLCVSNFLLETLHAFMVSFWLCWDRKDQISFTRRRWDKWLSRTQKQ